MSNNPSNQLNREQSRALLAASFSQRLRETEAVIVENVVRQEAERQKRGRVKAVCRACNAPMPVGSGTICSPCAKKVTHRHLSGMGLAKVKPAGVPVPSESASQQAVIRWWKLYHREAGIPERLLFAVPLQAGRTARNGARMKAEGARAGCLDLWLVVPRGGFTGCAIEMKRAPVRGGNRKGYLSDEQTAFISDLQDNGWQVCVCYSTDDAVTAISDYCALPIKNQED